MDTVDERTFGERVSDAVAKFGGSWRFIFIGIGIIIFWMGLQLLPFAWDHYPYILLNLVLSLVAAFQAPFIMMSQRRCEIKQDLIYRSLFREIKELIETDLSVEQEVVAQNKLLAEELASLKKIVQELVEERKSQALYNQGEMK
jgi:uncharacterized membrane protein